MQRDWKGARPIVVATLALTVGFLPIFLTGALAVQLQADLGFGATALGACFAIYFGVATVSSAPIGHIADRLGYRRSLRISAMVSALALVGVAAVANSWMALAVLLGLAGIGVGFAQPGANLLIAEAMSPGRYGLALGIKQSGIPIATLLGGATVPLFALTIGWEWGYAASAVLAAGTAVAVPRLESGSRRPAGRPPRVSAESRNAGEHRAVLLLLALGLTMGSAAASSSGAFAVSTAVEGGLAESSAALLYAGASVGGILIRLAAGHTADRRTITELRWVAGMLVSGAAGYVLLAVGSPEGIYLGVPIAIAVGWGWLGLFDVALIRTYRDAVGSVTGTLWVGAFLGGGLGPLAIGAMAEQRSLTTSWLVMAVLAVLAAASMVTVAAMRQDRAALRRTG